MPHHSPESGPAALLAAIPDEPTARAWVAESVRTLDLLRRLHALAIRKAALAASQAEGGEPCRR